MEVDSNIIYGIIIVVVIILIGCIWYNYSITSVEYMDPISTEGFPFRTYIINLDRKPERLKYVTDQLDNLGIKDYRRWIATDGFYSDLKPLINVDITAELAKNKGLAGCAASHVSIWRYIASNKLGWTLILEDDAHFHPQFMSLFPEYWKRVPKDAKIVFPGFCGEERRLDKNTLVALHAVMCFHGYMISHEGAQYLLDNIVPISSPIDVDMYTLFDRNGYKGSYIFNPNAVVNGIRPIDYKEANGARCLFNGIIYQNQQDQGTTLQTVDTLYLYPRDN